MVRRVVVSVAEDRRVSLAPARIAHDVVVSYGLHTVLAGLDFRASPGQRVGLVGENGSGKSKLLRVRWPGERLALT